MIKRAMLATLLATIGFINTSYADSAKRDFIASQLKPAIQNTTNIVKSSCGCSINITYNANNYKDKDELWPVKNFVETVGKESSKFCKDPEAKAAMCQVKTLAMEKGQSQDVGVKFANGTATAITGDSSFPSWDMLAKEIDK